MTGNNRNHEFYSVLRNSNWNHDKELLTILQKIENNEEIDDTKRSFQQKPTLALLETASCKQSHFWLIWKLIETKRAIFGSFRNSPKPKEPFLANLVSR